MKLITKIKKQLVKKGMSQRELAREIGVHYMTVQKWLNEDISPTIANLRRLDVALDLKLKLKDLDEYIETDKRNSGD